MKLLADTSALLALLLRDDRHHAAAAQFVAQHDQARFVLSELILAEVTTRVRARAGAARAVEIGRSLLASRRYDVLFVDERLVVEALVRLGRFADKHLSLTDCTSFVLIERLGLAGAFAFDDDFRACGYRMLP